MCSPASSLIDSPRYVRFTTTRDVSFILSFLGLPVGINRSLRHTWLVAGAGRLLATSAPALLPPSVGSSSASFRPRSYAFPSVPFIPPACTVYPRPRPHVPPPPSGYSRGHIDPHATRISMTRRHSTFQASHSSISVFFRYRYPFLRCFLPTNSSVFYTCHITPLPGLPSVFRRQPALFDIQTPTLRVEFWGVFCPFRAFLPFITLSGP